MRTLEVLFIDDAETSDRHRLGRYDIYDMQGSGNVNNDLATRASVNQAQTAYNTIIHDSGETTLNPLPTGSGNAGNETDQAGWYHTYLTTFLPSAFREKASVILIGEHWATQAKSTPLVNQDLRVDTVSPLPLDDKWRIGTQVSGIGGHSFVKQCPDDSNANPVTFGYHLSFSLTSECGRSVQMLSGGGEFPLEFRTIVSAGGSPARLGNAVVMGRSTNSIWRWNAVGIPFSWSAVTSPHDAGAAYLLGTILAGTECCREECCPCYQDFALVTVVDVPSPSGPLPDVALIHAGPNPFNGTTTFVYELPSMAPATLRIYNIAGRLVRTLDASNSGAKSGRHSAVWAGNDEAGRPVASGVYTAVLSSGGRRLVRKVVLAK